MNRDEIKKLLQVGQVVKAKKMFATEKELKGRWEKPMTQKAFFESLEAPLVNYRWSWGAVRDADGAILLRVWRDNVRTYEKKQFVRVLRGITNRPGPNEHGRRERVEHINRIRNGAQCFLIMCEAEDTTARPRRVKRFNAKEVFPSGSVRQIDDDLWVELLPSLSVGEFASRRKTANKW